MEKYTLLAAAAMLAIAAYTIGNISSTATQLESGVQPVVQLSGRFNVVWTGNGPESSVTRTYFLTGHDGRKTEIEVTPLTKFVGGQGISSFDGKMLKVLGTFDNSTGMFKAISIG